MVSVSIFGFALLLASPWGPFRASIGKGVSAKEANARLWTCQVPPEARDVWFISSYRATQVECSLEREVFQAWLQNRGWRPHAIDVGKPIVLISLRDPTTIVEVRNGISFRHMEEDSGFSGVYDVQRKRAYVQHSGG